jgi:periplasmic nitrate reductase NapE
VSELHWRSVCTTGDRLTKSSAGALAPAIIGRLKVGNREGHVLRKWAFIDGERRRQELAVFVVLTLLLAPVLAVTTVGGYGLAVWIYQMIAGPPGPPPKAQRSPGIVPKNE